MLYSCDTTRGKKKDKIYLYLILTQKIVGRKKRSYFTRKGLGSREQFSAADCDNLGSKRKARSHK